jgi:hypothetical protein
MAKRRNIQGTMQRRKITISVDGVKGAFLTSLLTKTLGDI